jgi:hypothetical protein
MNSLRDIRIFLGLSHFLWSSTEGITLYKHVLKVFHTEIKTSIIFRGKKSI